MPSKTPTRDCEKKLYIMINHWWFNLFAIFSLVSKIFQTNKKDFAKLKVIIIATLRLPPVLHTSSSPGVSPNTTSVL